MHPKPLHFLRPLARKPVWLLILLTGFFLVNPLFAANGQLLSKVVSNFSVQEGSLARAVSLLEKSSRLKFTYDESYLQRYNVKQGSWDKATLEKILAALLERTNLTFSEKFNTVIIYPDEAKARQQAAAAAPAQQEQIVKGIVTDKSGPVPGVTVRVKGTGTAVITDADGRFSVKVPGPASVLLVSSIGYEAQEVPLNGQQQVTITLQSSNTGLNEVIVVGYGTQRKANLLGAVSQIDSRELKTAPTANLSSMLQGRLPGLITKQRDGQPGSDGAALLVRGLVSPSAGGPLVVVDGVPRPFPNVNPDEIETISILKDAASAAVYGVRGANGVILVTTKRGAMGTPTISFNSSLSMSSNTRFPSFLNGAEYAYWYNKAQELDGVPENARRFTPDEISRIKNGDPQGVFANTDWFDLLFKRSAPVYTNNISLNGGSEAVRYFVSLGSYNQKGIIDRTSYDRYSIRANLDARVAKNLKMAVNIAAQTNETRQPGLSAGLGNSYASVFSQALLSYPFLPAYTATGQPVGSLNAGNGNQNPLAARDLSGEQNTKGNNFQGSMSLSYNVPAIPGLELKVNAAFDKGYSMRKAVVMPYKLMVYNMSSKTYSEAWARHALSGDASINQWFADEKTTTIQPSINYSNQFNKHAVSGLLLYEYIQTRGTGLSAGKRGFPITDIMDLNYGEEVIADLIKGGHSMFHRAGYVGRFNYSFDNRYLVEFTGRVDGSQNFPRDKRWGFFPAMALGWRISEEPFFKGHANFVDNLKLRASVGQLGNDVTSGKKYAYQSTMSLGKDPVVMIGDRLSRPLSVDGIPNTTLSWETTTSYNAGFESSLWKGLLGIELDLFYMVTRDILQGQGNKAPSLGGYFSSVVNAGIMDNRGFELVLTHNNRIGQFDYNVRGNVSWARNKVIYTTENANVPDYQKQTGRPLGQKYGFLADGLFQSEQEIENSATFGPTLPGDVRLRDLNGDGRITYEQDWTVIGRSNTPEMMFALNLGGGYKGFDFNVFFQGAALCDVALAGLYTDRGFYDNTFYTKAFWSDGNAPRYLVEGAWRPDNTNAKYPRLGVGERANGGKMSSLWVRNGAYLRLKSAQIGYSLPVSLLKRYNIEKVRFYVSGSNLFTLDHLPYLDPEMPDVNQGYYPQQRLMELGLNLTF